MTEVQLSQILQGNEIFDLWYLVVTEVDFSNFLLACCQKLIAYLPSEEYG